MYPKNELSYTLNFLHMMFGLPTFENEISPVVAKAIDKLLILHADLTKLFKFYCSNCGFVSCQFIRLFLLGIALMGSSTRWINQLVIEMLEKIKRDSGDVDKYVAKAKDKSDSFRLMGFGHRVYKNFDPRADNYKKGS